MTHIPKYALNSIFPVWTENGCRRKCIVRIKSQDVEYRGGKPLVWYKLASGCGVYGYLDERILSQDRDWETLNSKHI